MDNLESNLYRENIHIAPLRLRVGAYIIDIFLIFFIISIMFSDSQKEQLEKAYKIIQKNYNTQYTTIQLDSNPDNSALLNDLRINLKEAFEIFLRYRLVCIGLEIAYNFIVIYFYGATLGQIILRIKVINVRNFDKPSLHECMGRAIAKSFLGTTLYISFAIGFIDKWKQTIHDKIGKTIVVSN